MSWNECSRLPLPISCGGILESCFWWKVRGGVDVTLLTRENRLPLTGLGVEKTDGKGTTLHAQSIDVWTMEWKRFSIGCVFFHDESFDHASFSLLQLLPVAKNAKTSLLGFFWHVSWYKRERSGFCMKKPVSLWFQQKTTKNCHWESSVK